MNQAARIFRELSGAWHQDAAGERVDVLAAELAAQLATTTGSICVGLIKPEAVKSFFGLVYFLDGYGLTLRKRHRQQKDSVFVFVERRACQQPSEFEGAAVLEKPLTEVGALAA